MSLKAFVVGLALAVASVLPAASQETASSGSPVALQRTVMTWVPPYSRDASWRSLNRSFGGYGPFNALTRLGLQFWKPTPDGAVERVSAFGAISDAEIAKYVDAAHAADIKVMLTIYNGEPQWDWALAKGAFGVNRDKFVRALIAEMKRHRLDGVDVDLEGPGVEPTADDKAAYLSFMQALSTKLHARRKLVQIDTFAWIYNAPNQSWWSNLFPLVDTIASMGYEEIGRNAQGWASFAEQRKMAGSKKADMAKLILGLPSYQGSWQGDDALTQVRWFTPSKIRVGIGIWDAQLPAAPWRQRALWRELAKIRAQNR